MAGVSHIHSENRREVLTVRRVYVLACESHQGQRAGEEGCHIGREHSRVSHLLVNNGTSLNEWFLFSFSFWPGH